MDTVRIEYMLMTHGGFVIQNWFPIQTSVQNDPQIYIPRAASVKNSYGNTPDIVRVRVVSEQTNRIVDMFP